MNDTKNSIYKNYSNFSDKVNRKDMENFIKSYLKSLGFSYNQLAKKDPTPDDAENTCKDKNELMRRLINEIGDCKRCELYKTRTNLVFGVGNPCADIMFIGEAPGEEEDLKGEPFVGRAGRLLDKILESIGLSRKDNVYISNVLKSRPPENKIINHMSSIDACLPFLLKQIDIIKPKLIVCLGTISAHSLLKIKDPITKIRGRFFRYNDIKVITTYHPSYLLRNPIAKKEVWEDFKKIKEMLNRLREVENV
ncbi:MAG: uracil-DNA glycosylase [Proteobacteria bacterium]|nr:uracil-DNA glycosylase [Pseudomonadota bacterium]